MMILRRLLMILCVVISVSCYAQDTTCEFNPNYPTDDFIKHNQMVQNYYWNNDSKTLSAILKNGNLLSVRFWSCDHEGMSAKLFTYDDHDLSEQQFWNEKILWLGKEVLTSYDYQVLSNAIADKKAPIQERNNGFDMTIPDNDYTQFTVDVSRADDGMTTVVIFYYFS